MLEKIIQLPTDKKIAGVHCIPITEHGNIVMAWDKEEQLLTSIGGRVEGNEGIDEALDREAFEEVGLKISSIRVPFASWYWKSTDTYTVWFLVKVANFTSYSFHLEKSGYVISNVNSLIQIMNKLEPENKDRVQLLKWAEERLLQLKWI